MKPRTAVQGLCVLGIDPGTTVTGWGVVRSSSDSLERVASGVLRLRGERAAKLAAIFALVLELCEQHRPDALSLEQSFVGDNVQTAFRLGEARGSVMVAAARAGVTVHEYSPAAIKMAVAGSGRADKAQVGGIVTRLLGVTSVLVADEADALGAAICHTNTARFAARIDCSAPAAGGPALSIAAVARRARNGRTRWR